MELQNGYKVMYEARERMSTEKPGPIYAKKVEESSINDAMLISYNNDDQYIDLRTFKLIYDDGKHLLGSLKEYPTEEDTNIILKTVDGIVVFGKKIEG